RNIKIGSLGVAIFVACTLLFSCTTTNKHPKTYTVEIKDMKFVPADIEVEKGDTVLFVNKDMVTHDVTEQATKAWSSSPIPAGGSWKLAVTDDADYYCSIHEVMKGKIELK
ncbi:MAG TPA: plastocyanin/azurin family copper-binding protein, partial [Mucilaginibacter sp.]